MRTLPITEFEYKTFLKLEEELKDVALAKIKEYYACFLPEDRGYVAPSHISFIDELTHDFVHATGYDDEFDETFHYVMPANFLWDDAAFEEFKRTLPEIREAENRLAETEQLMKQAEEETRERMLLSKLKEKYPEN